MTRRLRRGRIYPVAEKTLSGKVARLRTAKIRERCFVDASNDSLTYCANDQLLRGYPMWLDVTTSWDEDLVQDIANKLRSAESQGWSELEKTPLRAMRNALILKLYTEGKTLEEAGEPFGLTRERARQLVKRLVGPHKVKLLTSRYRRSEKARRTDRERGRRSRASGVLQRNPERNHEIERLVHDGLSYAQVARAVGVTRNVVCTVMYRAKHREDEVVAGRSYPPIKAKGLTATG